MIKCLCQDVEYIDDDNEYVYDLTIKDNHNYFANKVLVHNCGSGKTITLIELMIKCRQPSLILLPDLTLQGQWYDELLDCNIPKDKIGLIGDGKFDYKNKWITLATVATVYRHLDDKEFINSFGFVAMDEIHICAALTYKTSINMFPAKYRFGASATCFRNDTLSEFIEMYCGRKFYTVTDEQLLEEGLLIKPKLIVRKTGFNLKPNFKYRNFYNYLINYLFKNEKRNTMIANDIVDEVYNGCLCLVVSTRIEHLNNIETILRKIDKKIRIGDLSGTKKGSCIEDLARLKKIDVIMGVNRVKMGLNIKPLECIFQVSPRSSEIDVTQIIGRVMRPDICNGKYEKPEDKIAKIYEYVDNTDILKNQFVNKRLPIYNKRCHVSDKINKEYNRKGE